MRRARGPAAALCAAGALMGLLPVGAGAQVTSAGAGIELRWALRGVVMSDAGRVAILEYRPTGAQRLVHAGDALDVGVIVGEIAPLYLTLGAGVEAVTLRLGHVSPLPRPVRQRFPIQRPRGLPVWVPASRQ